MAISQNMSRELITTSILKGMVSWRNWESTKRFGIGSKDDSVELMNQCLAVFLVILNISRLQHGRPFNGLKAVLLTYNFILPCYSSNLMTFLRG